MNFTSLWLRTLSLGALAALTACASALPPNEAMAVAEAAVTRASNPGTSDAAPAALAVAVNKLASSRAALARGETETARWLAEEAALDAQVADSQAQAARARKAALETQAAAQALREELNRKTPR
jgi:hypothetical protein